MGFAEAVAGRPILVIAVWLVVAVVSAPLFAALSSVVEEQQYSLPENSEAMMASRIMEEELGWRGSVAVIIVEGVDLKDNSTILKLVAWGKRFNETVAGVYLSKVNAVPLLLASLNETLYHSMLEALNTTAARAREVYESVESIDEAYAFALENASRQVEELNRSLQALIEADRAYARAYRELLELSEALNETVAGITGLDAVLVNTTDALLGLAQRLNETSRGLQEMDRAYAGLYKNLVEGSQRLSSLFSNKTVVQGLSEALALAWWQASRTYYYMEAYNGDYEAYTAAANLSAADPRLEPLPVDEALTVWRTVKALVGNGSGPDAAAAAVAVEMVANQTPTPRAVAGVVGEEFLAELVREAAEAGVPAPVTRHYSLPPSHVESQLRILALARSAAARAAERITQAPGDYAARALAAQLEAEGIPPEAAGRLAREAVGGSLAPEAVAELVASRAAAEMGLPENATSLLAALLVEADPRAEGVLAEDWGRAVEAAARLLQELGAPAPSVEAAEKILEAGMDRASAARIAAELLAEKLPSEAQGLIPLVLEGDPEARGLLCDPARAAELAAKLVLEKAGENGESPPEKVVERLAALVAEGRATPEAVREVALEVLGEKMAEETGAAEKAELIVGVLESYDPEARGVLAENETLAIEALLDTAERQGAELWLSPGELREALHDPQALRSLVAKRLREEAVERAPQEAKWMVERMVELVVSRGPGVPEEEKWRLVESIVREAAEEHAESLGKGFEQPGWLPAALAKLAVGIAKGELGAGSAAKLIAERLLLEEAYPRLLNETRGLLVSRDYDSFLVIGEPLGASEAERAENTLKAKRAAEQLLGEESIGYREVYVTGSSLLLEQVKEYARRDVERTSVLSELGTFIVLLVILESVVAVLLPYLGVFLGLVLGGAAAYIAAASGLLELSSQTQALMITTALGLGADYAGYIVHRFREEYARTGDPGRASAEALRRAGPAVVASALTVIIGFGSLLLGWDIGFLRSMGEAIPLTVASTALASLTLVPALLSLLGGRAWFWWPRRPSRERHLGRESRFMKALLRRQALVIAAMAVLMLVSAYFYTGFHGSHDLKLLLPSEAPAIRAFSVLEEEFTPGLSDPVYVVLVAPHQLSTTNVTQLAEDLAERLSEIEGVARAIAPGAGEAAGGLGLAAGNGRAAVVQVILGVDPYSSRGEEAIVEVHSLAHSYAEAHGVEAYVGGAPYAVLEMDRLLHSLYYTRILPAAASLMILVFTLIYGSLVVSIAALAVIIGAAMMGITASIIVFQDIMGEPIVWFLHIVSMMAVLGVGMDYNSFFLARTLEECHRTGCDPEKSVAKAAGAVSLFIVGLSLVVTSAYAALLTASNTGMREMGFTLATTVFLAGIMASYLLTPLVVSMLGRHAWWPWGMKRKPSHPA